MPVCRKTASGCASAEGKNEILVDLLGMNWGRRVIWLGRISPRVRPGDNAGVNR